MHIPSPMKLTVMTLMVMSLVACRAVSQTTEPSARSHEAIAADLDQAIAQLKDAIQQGEALQSPDGRAKAAAKGVPAIERILALFDEMSGVDPTQKQQLSDAALQFQVIGTLLNDPAQAASLAKAAAGDDPAASRAKAVLAMASYLAAPDDPGRNKAIDAFEIALKGAPDDSGVLALVPMTSMASPPSIPVYEHLVKILADDTASQSAQQLADQMQGYIKLKSMEDKPLVLSGVSLANPNFTTADWKGKVILVDFWATWCGPCLGELPRVKQMYAQYHGQGLEVLGVSCDNSGSDLRTFLKANPDMPWPQLFDDKTAGWHPLATAYGITSIPTMFLIDRKGILRTVDARSQLETMIPKLLGEQP